jgi:transcriptional regulator with XRE-family HTH domain
MELQAKDEDFCKRIKELRKALHYSRSKMAGFFRVALVTYRRYEQGLMLPSFFRLYDVAVKLGVSLDWLVCGRGPVYFKEIKEKLEKQAVHEANPPEITNLLDHMNRIPLLRNEILSYFYKLKAEHEGIIARGMEEPSTKS